MPLCLVDIYEDSRCSHGNDHLLSGAGNEQALCRLKSSQDTEERVEGWRSHPGGLHVWRQTPCRLPNPTSCKTGILPYGLRTVLLSLFLALQDV